MNGSIIMTLVTLRRSVGRRSRPASDGRENLVKAVTPVLLNRFEPKLTRILPIIGPTMIRFPR